MLELPEFRGKNLLLALGQRFKRVQGGHEQDILVLALEWHNGDSDGVATAGTDKRKLG
jgi:hypothetical protein